MQADVPLGMEDYPEAIRMHLAVLTRTPNNPLARYHLGFAYGMVGRGDEEILEYERALSLGLRTFDLYLNLGVARFEREDLRGAINAFKNASNLSDAAEPHYDLAIAYERQGELPQAEMEVRAAVSKKPTEPDYLNTLAIVSAEEGNLARARNIWVSLLSRDPGYHPAAANLHQLAALGKAPAVRTCMSQNLSRKAMPAPSRVR